MNKILVKYVLPICLSGQLSACSLSSYSTGEGLIGGLAGAAAGAGVGQIIGDEIGNKSENTAISAGVGAATGLAIGALIHENRAQMDQEEEKVIREAKRIDARQKEIDTLREDVYSNSSWGRLEVKPWHERYQIEESEYPYQDQSYP